MTALPQPRGHLLTVAEYAALGETEYADASITDVFITTEPFPVRLQLDRLL